jgi:hypothetical protein
VEVQFAAREQRGATLAQAAHGRSFHSTRRDTRPIDVLSGLSRATTDARHWEQVTGAACVSALWKPLYQEIAINHSRGSALINQPCQVEAAHADDEGLWALIDGFDDQQGGDHQGSSFPSTILQHR